MQFASAASSEKTMNVFNQLWKQILCMLGRHHGNNFCIYCGKQLAADLLFSFQVRSDDGRLNIVVKALNSHHAKRLLPDHYPLSELTAQRIADE